MMSRHRKTSTLTGEVFSEANSRGNDLDHVKSLRTAALILLFSSVSCRSASSEGSPSASVSANVISTGAAATGASANPDAQAEPDSGAVVQRGFICVPPLSGDFERCPKGAMAGDDKLRDCLRREAESPPKKPTFRIAGAASSTFSPIHWRCAEVALDTKIHVTIDTLAGLDETVRSTCASHAIDMVGPNQYGAIFFRCSRRARDADEIVARE